MKENNMGSFDLKYIKKKETDEGIRPILNGTSPKPNKTDQMTVEELLQALDEGIDIALNNKPKSDIYTEFEKQTDDEEKGRSR